MSLSPRNVLANLWAVFILCCVALSLAGAARAADRRVALVIGNDAYQHAPTLANPVDDAKAVSAALRGLGIDVSEGYNLTGREMRGLLIRFAESMAGAKGAVVFYAGHGVALDGVNYMLPVDIDLKSPADLDLNGFSVDVVLRQMRRDERVNIIILDACRDNPFAAALATASTRAVVATRGLEKIDGDLARGALIAFSTEPGRTAFDGAAGQHSPFTAALLHHIADPASPIETVMNKVRAEVYAATESRQLPWVNTSIIGEFQLNPAAAPPAPPPPAPAVQGAANDGGPHLTEDLLWQSAERSGAAEDYKTYLSAYPNGVFAPIAQRRIAAHAQTPEAEEAAQNFAPADRVAAQNALNALKLNAGLADGVFGPQARAAISAWQSRGGRPASGFLNKEQLAALVAEAPATNPAPQPVVAPKPAVVSAPKPAVYRAAKAVAPVAQKPAQERTLPAPEHRAVAKKEHAPHARAHETADPGAAPASPAAAAYGDAAADTYVAPVFAGPSIGFSFGSSHRHGWSDRRLKRDVRRVGTSPSGLPIYTFRYLWEDATYRGVMAQDLLSLRPEAVHRAGAYYWVDYSALDVKFERLDTRRPRPVWVEAESVSRDGGANAGS